MIGRTVSHYRIVEELGRGGMGVVFKAQDLQLGRTVALKFISENRRDHPAAFDRLWSEARAASTLNHPNICTIYEVGQDGDDGVFIVMEYIEGETLRDRLARKPLQINELLDIGIKIADGLSAAHEKRIVHRDIKSANILITPRGDVKIMDFGIAKRISGDEETIALDAPTDTLPLLALSHAGVIPGTLAYMSPEQTRGDELDQRSDLFSFGVVLYEMVTGTLPFPGGTSAMILEAIQVRAPIPPLSRRPDLPSELQAVIDTALEKDRDLRFQSASEMRAALARVKRQFSSDGATLTSRHTPAPQQSSKASRLTLFLSLAGLIVLAILGAVVWKLRPAAKPAQLGFLHTAQFSSSDGLDINASFSPDGKLVAYASDRTGSFEIYVRSRETGASELQITNKGAQCMFPRFSPDGQSLVFSSLDPAGLFRIPALGGAARRLTDFGAQPVWSPDGSQIAFVSHGSASLSTTDYYFPRDDSSIWLVSADGGTPRRITLPDKLTGGQTFPSWSPDGKEIRFVNYEARRPSLWTYSLADGALEKKFGRAERSTFGSPVFAPDGRMFYVSSTLNGDIGIWQVRLNPRTLKPEAEPEPLFRPGIGVPRDLSLAPDGKHVVYSAVLASSQLLVQNMEGNRPVGKPLSIMHETSYRYAQAKWFPDSNGVVYTRWQTGERAQIWQVKLDGSPQSPVSPASESQFFGQPLNDGHSVAFAETSSSPKIIFKLASLADGSAHILAETTDKSIADQPNFALDGSAVVFHDSMEPVLHIWKIDFKTGTRTQLTFGSTPTGYAHFSPDAKWISLQVVKQKNTEIAVIPSSGGTPEVLWNQPGRWFNGGWAPDKERLLVAGDDGRGWAVYALSRQTKRLDQLTKELPMRMYLRYPEWSPDGKHIVYEFNESKGNVFLAELP